MDLLDKKTMHNKGSYLNIDNKNNYIKNKVTSHKNELGVIENGKTQIYIC
jgi:hypothetical protein